MAIQEKPTKPIEQKEQKKELKLDQADQKKVSAPKSLQLHEKFLGKRRFPGNTFGRNRERKDDLEKKVIAIRRVAHTFAGGKRLRLSVCVVVGDRKGSVGIGSAKGADVMTAEEKAVRRAKKSMTKIYIKGTTIPHEIFFKKGAAKIFLKPAAPGTGVIAGAAVRAVCEVAGIKDILTKVLGSDNAINNATTALLALKNLKGLENF